MSYALEIMRIYIAYMHVIAHIAIGIPFTSDYSKINVTIVSFNDQ